MDNLHRSLLLFILLKTFSHLVAIPHGMNVTESIFASALFEGEGSFAPQMAGGAGMDDFGGIDPNMEPELALALRLSAEEARVAARQTSEDAPSAEDNTNMAVDGMDFDDELAQAIALSMMDANNASTSNMASSVSPDKQVAQESQPIASTSFEDDIDDVSIIICFLYTYKYMLFDLSYLSKSVNMLFCRIWLCNKH